MNKLAERHKERSVAGRVPAEKPAVQPAAAQQVRPLAADTPHAPLIFFDEAPTVSARDGVIGFTLTAGHHLPLAGGHTASEAVVAAHLRCSLAAARRLHDALGKVLLLAAKPEGERH